MVEINLPDPNSLLNGKSVPSISFKDAKVGDAYTGTITALETAQVRNYESGDPEFWEDGNPKLQIVVTLATTYGDGAEDDGERKVYLFGQKLQAAKAALKEAGLTKLEIGSTFTITYSGTKPSSNKKYNDVKLYTIAIVKGTSNPAVDTLLAAGAKPVDGDKLSAEQIEKIKKLSGAGLNDEEIAESMHLNRYSVIAVLEADKPF
jgi:uncharacterized protein with beta-barrel porin domain